MSDPLFKDIIPTKKDEEEAQGMITEVDGVHSQTVGKIVDAYQQATGETRRPDEFEPPHIEGATENALTKSPTIQQFIVGGQTSTRAHVDDENHENPGFLTRELSSSPTNRILTGPAGKFFKLLKKRVTATHPGQAIKLGSKEEQKSFIKKST